jgi:hypothetical protein
MKTVFIFCLGLMASISQAAEIQSGRFNSVTNKVELTVSYGGGCSEHTFKLQLSGGCAESYPVQCSLNLVHTTDKPDFCEALITEDLKLDLPAYMLTDEYFEGAYIRILNSNVRFQLPR